MKLLLSVLFIIMLCYCASGYAVALEIPESLLISIIELEGGEEFLEAVGEKIDLLEEAFKQIETDQLEIDQLRLQRDIFEQEVWNCNQEINYLESELQHTKGLYAGAIIGYPFFTGMGIIEYRFQRWSPIIFGGYSERAFIGAGVNFRIGKLD